MSEFKERIVYIINSIPFGKVMSYGQIAVYIGAPRAARQVGWTMRQMEGEVDLPWWRVINNEGIISIKGNLQNDKVLQKKLLEAEGIEVSDDFILDIKKYRYIAPDEVLKQLQLDEAYIKMLHTKFFRT
jgi:methylated-DNA-protein-cysteine methyltransferase-like protein